MFSFWYFYSQLNNTGECAFSLHHPQLLTIAPDSPIVTVLAYARTRANDGSLLKQMLSRRFAPEEIGVRTSGRRTPGIQLKYI